MNPTTAEFMNHQGQRKLIRDGEGHFFCNAGGVLCRSTNVGGNWEVLAREGKWKVTENVDGDWIFIWQINR